MESEHKKERLPVRIKLGLNPYRNEFVCSHCRTTFMHGGFILNIECAGKCVLIPLCEACLQANELYEGMVDISSERVSPRLGLA